MLNVRTRRREAYNFEDGLKVKGRDIEQMIAESLCTGDGITGSTDLYVQNLFGDDVTTAFTLIGVPVAERFVDVYIGGIYCNKTNYTISGNILTFTEPPVKAPDGEPNIEVLFYQLTMVDLTTVEAELVRYKLNTNTAVQRNAKAKLDEYVTAKDYGLTLDVTANLYLMVGVDGHKFKSLGYNTNGDGGQDQFYWDNTSNEADNGVTVIKPTGYLSVGRWISVSKDAYFVDNFTIALNQTTTTLTKLPIYGTCPKVVLNNVTELVYKVDFEMNGKDIIYFYELTAGDTISVCTQIKDLNNSLNNDSIYQKFTISNLSATYTLSKTPLNPKGLKIVLNDFMKLAYGIDWTIVGATISLSYPLEIGDTFEVSTNDLSDKYDSFSVREMLNY